MTSPMERHRIEMEMLAYPAVRQFIANNPDFSISPDQEGSTSATNYVIFGKRGQQDVIFKYFCEDERKQRECYALTHFANTNLVPQLLVDAGPRLIVQSRIAGSWLPDPTDIIDPPVDSVQAGYTLGEATAKLLAVPFSDDQARRYEERLYDGLSLERYLYSIFDAATFIAERVPAYSAVLFKESLQEIQENLPFLLAQKRVLYHQDAMNMHFLDSRFSGFFDLEMCRAGTFPMQIGSLWVHFSAQSNWQSFSDGYANYSGQILDWREFKKARAFANFMVWRYISRYGRWSGDTTTHADPGQVEHDAAQYLKTITSNFAVSFQNR